MNDRGIVKQLFHLAGAFALGYLIVFKTAPVLISRLEAMNLDEAWDVFDE